VWLEVNDKRGHFAMLSVDPAIQGRGYGRALIAAIEKHCRDAGCEAVDIEVVNLREELPAFYEALGFVTTETAPFPDNGKLTREAHLVLMTKPF
jgi:ribosomal protein S18 acetylase RimI-like enzyme